MRSLEISLQMRYPTGMLSSRIISYSDKETQKVAKILAEELVKHSVLDKTGRAMILALEGELGSGKTTFSQGLAKALGIKEKVLSPTFVLVKIYPTKKVKRFRHLIHVDCYRLKSPKDLLHLGFKNFLKDRDAIIIVEWADRIKSLIPKDAIWCSFLHLDKNKRIIKIS